jgi:hypothetical protein
MEQLRDELFKECPNNGCSQLVPKSGDATHAEECDRKPISVWNGGKYIGDCKDGKPHGDGKGTICLLDDGEMIIPFWHTKAYKFHDVKDYLCTYEGQWEEGQPHGEGKAKLHLPGVVCTYTGGWKKNRPHGKGEAEITVASEDGRYNHKSYDGWWVRGLRHGFGVLHETVPGKRIRFQGRWVNDVVRYGRLGKNPLYESYVGELLFAMSDDFPMPHGHGEMKFENGDSYCGQFVHGKPRMLRFLLSNGKTAPTDHGGSSRKRARRDDGD